jgi:ATP-binding cassette subfamily B protein
MDEAFRGLQRTHRKTLLERARAFWKDATLLAVTHDVEHALAFDRVLVIDRGTIVEDGRPSQLAEDRKSRFRLLLDAERQLAEEIQSLAGLRRIRIEQGQIVAQQKAS